MMFFGLFLILLAVLVLPFSVRKIEEQLELFLFIMGLLAITITSQWGGHLVREALVEPIKITIAVLVAGIIFKYAQRPIGANINKFIDFIGIKPFIFFLVVILGIISSFITAIIAALVLVEIVSHLRLDRKNEIIIVVLTCFSIGMGAALTPIGEPLSTIAIGKLKGFPYFADFWFLARIIGPHIIAGVIGIGITALLLTKDLKRSMHGLKEDREENMKDVFLRTGKVYLFVMALVFLGTGFKPIVDEYISKMPFHLLYWLNSLSAVLDNATLAAAEIGPSLSMIQIKSALLGLIIAGGMLIPGNIPNIISAGKLKIKSKEWAMVGLPVGIVAMAVFFAVIEIFG